MDGGKVDMPSGKTEAAATGWWNGEPTVEALVKENERRNHEMFDGFNPITGRGAPGPRKKVKIPDCPIRVQYMPERIVEHNIFLKKVLKRGSIRKYIEDELGWEFNDETFEDVVCALFKMRAEEDPAFAFAMIYKIVDKEEGTLIPFVLNYGQRKILALQEKMRLERRPIRIVLPKARQFGGSTETQLYGKWMQDFKHQRWNMAIMAHQTAASIRIRAMYDLALDHQPGWSVGLKGRRLKSAPFKGSTTDFVVKTTAGEEVRGNVTSVVSYENYDASRSSNLKMAHLSEVAYWKETEQKKPEGVLSSINGTVGKRPDTMIVMESSGRTVGDFFYNMYQEAKNPDIPSAWEPLFVAYYEIELYRDELMEGGWKAFAAALRATKKTSLNSEGTAAKGEAQMLKAKETIKAYRAAEREFAEWLIENKDNPNNPKGYRESGKYFWQQWQKGASMEAINWYRNKRNEYRTHSYMATEFPADDVECFMAAGNLIFDKYCVDAMRMSMEKQPIFVGNIVSDYDKGINAIKRARLVDKVDDGQVLRIWRMPDGLKVSDRYVVSVDIGGSSRTSDFTVMTVIDRFGMMPGMYGKPQVVARWRGHMRFDLLAWKAAQLAHLYGDAKLVIEKNTADTRKQRLDEEGDHFGTIIDEIADYYPNLYIRATEVDKVTQKVTNIYGFHTNTVTKELVIDCYKAYVEDALYVEPDKQAFDELMIYERKEDGTMGNSEGKNNHDDIVMSTGIGLYVSLKMPLPQWIKESTGGLSAARAGTEADL
jgi:hypothetical protein